MKQCNVLIWIFVFVLGSVSCETSNAQDLKSIISGVANAITNGKSVSSSSLEGTWNYAGADCKFSSDNLLSKAGGEVVANQIEEKMESILSKLGFDENSSYTFNDDNTFSSTINGHTTSGTYSYDSSTNELEMKSKLGLTVTAEVSQSLLSSGKISLLFNADKLMSLFQTVSGTLGSSSSSLLSTANSLLENYDGLQLGFELKKQ